MDKSIKDLRKELKEKRAGSIKAPSKMKKAELLAELGHAEQKILKTVERAVSPHVRPVVKKAEKDMAALHAKETVLEKAPAPKKAPKKAPAVKESLPPKPVKDLPKPEEVKMVKTASEGVKRLVAGSQEARDKMARLREMRNAKKNVD